MIRYDDAYIIFSTTTRISNIYMVIIASGRTI